VGLLNVDDNEERYRNENSSVKYLISDSLKYLVKYCQFKVLLLANIKKTIFLCNNVRFFISGGINL